MPLVVMVGGPCSGKTYFANKIKEYYESKGNTIHLINEESLNVSKKDCYADSQSERTHRSHIKSEVEKNISDNTITIVDSLNYIKGSRYEFFCLVRNLKTKHCVIYIKTPLEKCIENNEKEKLYEVDLLKDLYSRMEEPIGSNRWDCPLYVVYPDDEIPFDDLNVSLFEGRKLKEPQSTKSEISFDTNFLFHLDKNCQDVVNSILDQQETITGNFEIEDIKFSLSKKFTAVQLKKIKMEFIKISKVHPPKDKKETIKNFIEYIITVQNRY